MRKILEHRPLPSVLSALAIVRVKIRELDWYVSDVEGVSWPSSVNDAWLRGSDLETLLSEPDISLSWAVFSAFRVGTRPPVMASPFADGNAELWKPSPASTQLPGAAIELVVWDSSALILTGISDEQARSLEHAFPGRALP